MLIVLGMEEISLPIEVQFAVNSKTFSWGQTTLSSSSGKRFVPSWPHLPRWLFPSFHSAPWVGECSEHKIYFLD